MQFTRLAPAPIVLRRTDDICLLHTPRVIARGAPGFAPVRWRGHARMQVSGHVLIALELMGLRPLDSLFRYADVGTIYLRLTF